MANPTPPSEQEVPASILVCRAQDGDRNAFDTLARRYRPLLFAMAFLRTSHREEAEDLVQSVLASAWQKLFTLADATRFLPWLKTVMANACISWYRRTRGAPCSLEEDARQSLPTQKDSLLELFLIRERERQVQQALLTLPEANRLALLMHVWGDTTYADIAAFTGVSVSTVDGRIYRAKRQLRRLLSDSGAEFLEDGERERPPVPRPVYEPQKGRKKMPTTITTAAAKTWEQSLALAVFTRRLSLMLDAGVSLQRALQILQEMPPPYGDAARDFQGRVEHGEHLSQAMADRPGLFPPVYTGMIRAGEVGGVPEETVQRLKKVLEREWKLANRHPSQEMPLFLLLSAGQSLPVTWEEMSSYHRTVTLSLFFEAFGMMLQSGVPILQAMRTVADLLPKGSHAGWAKATRNVVKGLLFTPEMERMGIFPPFALEMIQIGEESGSLDIMMHRLSESFEDDLEYRSVS